MQGEHSHYEKYITRIVTRIDKNDCQREYIQFICEMDGIIFDEKEIINKK
jgi:hypothetical protein